jgi:hypothetical protein
MQSKKINELATNVAPSVNDLTVLGDAATGQLKKITLSQISSLFGGTGTVSSVAMTVPTGLSITGTPITTSGTLALTFTAGYSIPTIAKQTEWDAGFADRLKWDGGASGLNAATARTSLGLVIGTDVLAYRTFGTAANNNTGDFATAAQGANADTAYSLRLTGASAPLSISGNVISLSQANTSTSGFLSSTDWNTFNGKQNAISLNTNRAVSSNSSGALVASITTATELAYLNGVTSNVQAQIDSKAGTFTLGSVSSSPTNVLAITGSGAPVNGSLTFTINQSTASANGYLSSTDWNTFNNKQSTISLTANRAVSSNSGGALVASITTATELAYLNGVTSNVQTQLDSKAGTFTLGSISSSPSGVLSITGSGAPVNGSLTFTLAQASASTSGYLSSTDWNTFNNSATGNYLALTGGSLTGSLTINDGNQLNLGQGGSSNVPIDFYSSNFGSGYEGRIMGNNSDGNTHFYSRNNNASFTDIGYFDNTGMYITYYGSYSDIRLKDVIETNPNINLDGIDVIKYTLKSNPTLVRYGYSAQQVQSVLPDLVTLNKRIDGNNEDATLMLNYNDLYVLKIAALEKRILELENKLK